MAGESRTTTDHETIRKWAEARGGKPAAVKRTESNGDVGLLRIDFPGYKGADSLEDISWDEFFKKFDEKHLVFLYQEHTAGGEESRFFKFLSSDTAGDRSHKSGHKGEEKSDKSHKSSHK